MISIQVTKTSHFNSNRIFPFSKEEYDSILKNLSEWCYIDYLKENTVSVGKKALKSEKNLFTKNSRFFLKVKVGQISLRPILHLTLNPNPQAISTLRQPWKCLLSTFITKCQSASKGNILFPVWAKGSMELMLICLAYVSFNFMLSWMHKSYHSIGKPLWWF